VNHRRPIAVAAGIAAAASYALLVRPWHLRWGARREEIERPMPADNIVEHPTSVTNRAITIAARPEEVWPWLAQMGESPRAGFYSYQWVERLMGMTVKNADRILPEGGNLEVGQTIDCAGNLQVKAFEPGRHLVLGPAPKTGVEATWAMALYPEGDAATRLVSRVRSRPRRSLKGLFWTVLLDPGQFLMERKMLLGIKRRAENGSRAAASPGQRFALHG
jgi:hypothetical protein